MITATLVKDLREKTGAGMMDCKKVLTETDGDLEKAMELLRERGIAKAAKKSDRIAAEGMVYALCSEDSKQGVLVEVNSETDFVAKNDEFKAFVQEIAEQIMKENPSDVATLLTSVSINDATKTVNDILVGKIANIGENISIRRFARYETNGIIQSYIHGEGKIGVLVNIKTSKSTDNSVVGLSKDICMQIAAANAKYLNREEVPADIIEKEKEILKAQAINEGKPAEIAEKMVNGRINKFYQENCLLEQSFVKDPDMNITKLTQKIGNEVSDEIEITKFARFEKGEGIEKRQEDFAAEVAKQING